MKDRVLARPVAHQWHLMANVFQNLSFKVSYIQVPPGTRAILNSAPTNHHINQNIYSPVPVLICLPLPVFHLKLAQLRSQVHQCDCNYLAAYGDMVTGIPYSININVCVCRNCKHRVDCKTCNNRSCRRFSNLWFPLKAEGSAETVIHKCPRHLNLNFIWVIYVCS